MLGRLQLNGFEMTASKAEGASGGHRPVGIGVFPSASWTNHSCAPNCRQSFDSHGCIVVETARAVRKDEELTIPYVDTRLGRSERRERLRKNFAFDCACERCAAEA
jgi:SET and MYND domain-containing protein